MKNSKGQWLMLVLCAVLAATMACGDDPTGNGNALVGTWNVTSLTFPGEPGLGDPVVDDGLVFRITFNANGTYAMAVSNDDPSDPWICEGTTSCTEGGDYSVSGSSITFDEGTSDEATGTFSISGDTLTMTGGDVRFVAQRV